MTTLPTLTAALLEQRRIATEVLGLVELEAAALGNGGSLPSETAAAKQRLLPRLASAARNLRQQRELWQHLSPEERGSMLGALDDLRCTQELLMKVILRDRENEQRLLRAGAVPARHFSKVQPQASAHFVANLYRKNAG